VCVASQDPQRQKALVVADKSERVFRFHENTLKALKELVQAAGLRHPSEISAFHIVRRAANDEVRLLANVLPFVASGSLLAPARGAGDWPHAVFRLCWALASADSFAAQLLDAEAMPAPDASTWGLFA
jgi:hypothetical protein